MSGRVLAVVAVGAAGIAALSLIGIALSDAPFLSLYSVNAWVVVWAVALLTLFGLMPFALHERVSRRTADHDRRWELAIVAWGAAALVGVLGFGAVAVAEGLGGETALGAIATVGLIESALVFGAVALLVLTTG